MTNEIRERYLAKVREARRKAIADKLASRPAQVSAQVNRETMREPEKK